MSEEHAERRKPKRRVTLADLTTLVSVPGQPLLVRAFADDELAEAKSYAAQHGGELRDIRLPAPSPQ